MNGKMAYLARKFVVPSRNNVTGTKYVFLGRVSVVHGLQGLLGIQMAPQVLAN